MEKKLIIVGRRIVNGKFIPFSYVSKEMEDKILEKHPEADEYSSYYVITTKAFVGGDVLYVMPCNSRISRDLIVKKKEEFESQRIFCYFSKIIASTSGKIEKDWTEKFHMERIQKTLRKKRKRMNRKKKVKNIFYNAPHTIIEKKYTSTPLPTWLAKHFNPEHRINGEKIKNFCVDPDKAKVVSVEKDMVIFEGKAGPSQLYDYQIDLYYRRHYLNSVRKACFPYKYNIGVLRFNMDSVNPFTWKLIKERRFKELHNVVKSNVFRYFIVLNYYEIGDGSLIIVVAQNNDMPKTASGIPMEVFLKLLRKGILRTKRRKKTGIEKVLDETEENFEEINKKIKTLFGF